ncbi:cell division protein FtsQ/DivIB [Xanthobacter versatilis]|uniref:cell division protein FtsQ/DivIB n=1 Tax=Xanthobacter autotrophicus (strain ATCC BAA-1158 / Py2) TaxID=78245 RepID=UPI0037295BCB
MDGGGRFAGALRPRTEAGRKPPQRPVPLPPPGRHKRLPVEPRPTSRMSLLLRRLTVRLGASRLGRRSASLLTIAVVGGFSAYGIMLGGHAETAKGIVIDVADAAGNVAGFKVKEVNISGHNHVTPAEILETAGIKSSTSILFLNADEMRARLEALPWIQSASVRKFYPDRIDIAVAERQAFALWQVNGELKVIARDGIPIAPYSDDPRYVQLPIVVGEGAQKKVGEVVDALARVPALRDQVRAAIRVAERRWTLKMRNGIDVRLPEEGLDEALVALMDLDREKKLLSRDVSIVDLRLPDRVVVRLSDAAADARAQMLKARAKAKKGGPA